MWRVLGARCEHVKSAAALLRVAPVLLSTNLFARGKMQPAAEQGYAAGALDSCSHPASSTRQAETPVLGILETCWNMRRQRIDQRRIDALRAGDNIAALLIVPASECANPPAGFDD